MSEHIGSVVAGGQSWSRLAVLEQVGSVGAGGQCCSRWAVLEQVGSVGAGGQCWSRWAVLGQVVTRRLGGAAWTQPISPMFILVKRWPFILLGLVHCLNNMSCSTLMR